MYKNVTIWRNKKGLLSRKGDVSWLSGDVRNDQITLVTHQIPLVRHIQWIHDNDNIIPPKMKISTELGDNFLWLSHFEWNSSHHMSYLMEKHKKQTLKTHNKCRRSLSL